jgi:hypothetical protein
MDDVTKSKAYRALAMLVLLVFGLGLRCGDPKKKKSRYDGFDAGAEPRKECGQPTFDCYDRCDKRGASNACMGCCWDQHFLCDTYQPYDFAQCDGAK